ncbi:MAG: o-succinylbenzoate synthase [Rhodocyclaceae bacterium]|nr:o-succinylbenzoate synthase [Rhodocyclaceae bacterium]
MHRRSAALFRYRVPLAPGAALRQPLTERTGLIVHLVAGERQGWGEIAPLPGFSREILAEAQAETRRWLERWLSRNPPAAPELPAVAFGIGCALAELDGRLPEAADYATASLRTCAADAVQPSATLAKLKLGLGAPEHDALAVNALFANAPDLVLRLDANRAWTLAQAQAFARGVKPEYRSRIEFLEEPCATPQESLAFAAEAGIAVAWDETLREPEFALTSQPGLRAVVVKPTLTGGPERCRELVDQAHALGLTAVISSSIESSLGLTQLARLAAWLTPQTTPGLDTLAMMKAQVLRPWPGADLPLLTPEDLECLWQS